jgi:predicted outer membrane protein
MLAKRLGVALPLHVNANQKAALAVLSKLRGGKFDVQWLQVQVASHKLAIAGASKEVKVGTNPAVKREAKLELPVLQHHLATTQTLIAAFAVAQDSSALGTDFSATGDSSVAY